MSFYDNLENAIGSVHYWAPGIPVAVYDLGLSAVQRAKLGCFLGVSVLDFDFSSYPPHVRDLYTYSWKPILYRDATLRFGKVLLIDSGIEVRTPLDYVFEAIDTTGYFFVQATTAFDYMGKMVHPGMLSYLQVPRSLVEGRQMCYAGMHGYRADSDIVQNVLEPTVECMMHAECVDPPGAGHDNHRYEQAAFSIFMRKHGIYCHDEDRFREDKPMLASWDPTQEHQDFTFFFRRWRYPKPYTHLISRIAECVPRKASESSERHGTLLVESTATKRRQSEDGMVKCLQANNHDHAKCKSQIDSSQPQPTQQLGSKAFAQHASFNGHVFAVLGASGRAAVSWVPWVVAVVAVAFLVAAAKLKVQATVHATRWRTVAWALLLLSFGAVLLRHHRRLAWFWHRQCSSDSEGAWRIAVAHFRDDAKAKGGFPTATTPSSHVTSMLTCATPSDLSATFVADPFLTRAPDRPDVWYLFFEVKDAESRTLFWNGKAPLAVAMSDNGGQSWQYGGLVLEEPFHLSYPYVFWHEGQPYMTPEAHRGLSVRLYTTKRFPYGWYVVRELLSGQHFVDPTVFQHNGHWYLFCTLAGAVQDQLFLYHSDHLLGPFVQHPSSPVVRGSTKFARSAGRPFVDSDGRLIRFSQDITSVYGEHVFAIHITDLTPLTYSEAVIGSQPFLRPSGVSGDWNEHRMHHIDLQRLDDGSLLAVMDAD